MALANSFEVVSGTHRSRLGEGPLWSERQNALFWVDIMQPAVHRLALSDYSAASWQMPDMIGWIVERENHPGFIAGIGRGFAELSLETLEVNWIGHPEPGLERNRMNDAKVDAHGRIWAGIMDTNAEVEDGSLYRLDTNRTWHKVDDGYLVPNGPTFSYKGDRLYHADSLRRVVYEFDLDPSGDLTNKRPFIRFEDAWGFPDGMTTDSEGCLWIAHFGGGRVSRFSPSGEMLKSISLPASQITSCVFAGPDLDRLFVTSAAEDKSDEPLAGAVFEIDPGVKGLPSKRFMG